jgi:hypothetical protein
VSSAAGIVSAFNGSGNDVMPMGLNGSKLAFYTGGTSQDLLHSQTSVNTGEYVHVVVTRNQLTGEKKIYVNGVLDVSDFGSTDLLFGTDGLTIGLNNSQTFTGEMDEIQFYSGVLSASEVLQLYNNPGTVIPDVAGSAANGLVAHYTFDDSNNIGADSSGNGYDLDFNGGDGVSSSNKAQAGSGAAYFDGGSFLSYSSTPSAVLNALAGDFSLSFWIETTENDGNEGGEAYDGDGLVAADVPGSANDLVPAALDGGEIGFNTGPDDDTLNSTTDINDGNYHHVVITRSQATGEKQIYIDGVLNNSDSATTNLLNAPVLVAVGCAIDASQANPNNANPQNYFLGLMDDLQIYSRVVSSAEVSFLYNNPGATIGSSTYTPYPVDVSLQFYVTRSQDPNFGEYFSAGVSFNSVNPAPTTTNSVHSPNNYYNTEVYPSGGDGGGVISSSLSDVINEFTNGSWTISINQGSPTQQVYTFQASISGLDTNLLKAVKVFYPTNGSVNVATNPVYYWNGPTNYSTLVVDLLSGPHASLPITATNWLSAPILSYGSNRFDVNYTSNNYPGVTFTTPVDAYSNSVRTWTTTVGLSSESFNNIVVGAPAPLPVLLTNLTRASGNLQFSFQTLAGRPHTIQSRTNLTLGAWVNLTNFVGDGSLKQFVFPATNPPIQFFRVNTQ